MNINIDALKNEPRLLIEAKLKPVAGTRFQPTGFPDLGPATYNLPDGTPMLLVESAQSMANHMEKWCLDQATNEPIAELAGMPFVESILPDGSITNSLVEAHRLNSPYIVHSKEFAEVRDAIGFVKDKPFDRQKLVAALFKYDPNSLIHGIFLEKLGGVVRLPRALTAFIEARNVKSAPSGGTKFDRVQPESNKDKTTPPLYGKAEDGYGNVIYPREDFTAEGAGEIRAFFNLDLALIEGFRLTPEGKAFLVLLGLLKIRRLLELGLKLRANCDLEAIEVTVTRPRGWHLPTHKELLSETRDLISKNFAGATKKTVRFDPKLAKAAKKKKENGQGDKSSGEELAQ